MSDALGSRKACHIVKEICKSQEENVYLSNMIERLSTI